jgi:predicted Zn-ribbon and HTH transcriptional regulator
MDSSITTQADATQDLPKLECLRCGYKWTPRVSLPAVCPSCKRRNWNTRATKEVKNVKDTRDLSKRLSKIKI